MICYRDMAFCSAKCKNKDCFRNFTEEEENLSILWGGPDAPVAFSDFSKKCESYDPEE